MNVNFKLDLNLNREASLLARRELELQPYQPILEAALVAIRSLVAPKKTQREVPPAPADDGVVGALSALAESMQRIRRSVRAIRHRLEAIEFTPKGRRASPLSSALRDPFQSDDALLTTE